MEKVKVKVPVRIGQRVKFRPFDNINTYGDTINGEELLSDLVREGTVVFINEDNQWFSVEWGRRKARTSFKFTDIGKIPKRRKCHKERYPKCVEIID